MNKMSSSTNSPLVQEVSSISTSSVQDTAGGEQESTLAQRQNLEQSRKRKPSLTSTPENPTSTEHCHEVGKEDSEAKKLRLMSEACTTILTCIGEDPSREGLLKTPERWAKALLFMTSGYSLTPEKVLNGAVFSADSHKEIVVVKDIDIHSMCEHHMVPFTGRVHVGYIPNGKIIGLSKIARIAEVFSRRLQVQERLTRQIADAMEQAVQPLGVGVVMESSHFCMVMRGVQKVGAKTVTSCVRGCFESNQKTRAEFFNIINGRLG